MKGLRKLGYPFSLLYAFIVFVRNRAFDSGIFASKSFTTPTVCIGNLSVGGTGKTPMVEFLISALQNDMQLAVLSRGYKRKSKGFLLANATSTVESLGDEPYQIYRKFPKLSVAVDGNRARGIAALERQKKPELIILDDAFQHRKVNYSFRVLLTAYPNLYADDCYLPVGNLRDSRSASQRADVIVVTKCPETLSKSERAVITKKLHPLPHQKVLFSTLQYHHELKGGAQPVTLGNFLNEPLTVVTGIANPSPMLNYLAQRGLRTDHMRYADHHYFTQADIALLNTKTRVLTTEKDFVKLKGKVKNLYYLEIAHQFLGDDEAHFLEAIRKAIR
ncbi:tetraacyldisaccharide 4'-kinase [Arenibacter sp. GZD96]|uniref:tetraacyldisaccharide 4'-kinase n=1 Tax=Aurantibrevibacter litoralis TaxID=3106030 RepID=UPI002AFE1D5A|nr:tetraacyldisaccharide 4'-kinase [Arenibacter sp. GZD-96]MEA1786681.1 tetraacyldisaccharide 4'-kinase [Arenibacter sp. GZD-96]